MARIFISYKRADKTAVLALKERIETATGESCWIDLDGIESDAQFISVIIRAINEADIFLFMYSQRHAEITDFEKDWTIREINLAEKKEKRIVFVNLDKTPLTDYFELLFGFKQQIDATDNDSFNRLISDIRKWLNINPVTSTKEPSLNTPSTSKLNPRDNEADRAPFAIFHSLFPESEYTYAWLSTNGVTIKQKNPHTSSSPDALHSSSPDDQHSSSPDAKPARANRGIVTLEGCTRRPDGSITCRLYLLTMTQHLSELDARHISYKPCWTGAPALNGITLSRTLEILTSLKNLL